ncbi:MAG: bacteriohemerythrin [Treponema sp.]|jgi:hemerythrin|nr:bacteriohemerythrin [Treponema sp.]
MDEPGRLTGIIRELREAAGISAVEAAESIGVSLKVYEKYEAGSPAVPIDILYKISNHLGIDVTAQLTGKDPRMNITIVCRAGKDIEVIRELVPGAADKDLGDSAGPALDKAGKEENPPAKEEGSPEKDDGVIRSGLDVQTHKPVYRSGLVADSKSRILEWQRAYSTGISFFDEQHKKFIDLINDLYMDSQADWQYSQAAFMRMIRYTVQHFQTNLKNEEKIMEQIGYPEYKAHKREHVLFLKEVLNQVLVLKADLKIDAKDFVLFLRDWIMSHVAISDKKLSLYLGRLRKEGNLNNITMRVKRDSKQRLIIS